MDNELLQEGINTIKNFLDSTFEAMIEDYHDALKNHENFPKPTPIMIMVVSLMANQEVFSIFTSLDHYQQKKLVIEYIHESEEKLKNI